MENILNKNTIIKDNHIFFKRNDGDLIVINPDKLTDCINYINTKSIKGVMINPSIAGKNVSDVNFLNKIASIERLSILQNDLDLSPINNLHNLTSLSIEYKIKGKIDLVNLSNLEFIGYQDNSRIFNLDKCAKLKSVNIHGYKEKDLTSFKAMTQLMYIYIYRPNIRNFDGLEDLKLLEAISLDSALKLESLHGLTLTNKNLKKLHIYNSKNLTDYSDLKDLVSLEDLIIQKAKDIPSISFLKEFKKLKRVILGGMKILDGDFSPLKDIPESFAINSPYNTLK